MNTKYLPWIGLCFLLTLFACFQQIAAIRLFREPTSRDGRTYGRHSRAVFGPDSQVKSGARSAYQLAPFGEGFGFADLFSLFGKRNAKEPIKQQPDKDGLPFQLDDNQLIAAMYEDQTPIVRTSKVNNKDTTSAINQDLKSSITKARRLNLAPWDRIVLADKEPGNNQSAGPGGATPGSPIILVPGYGGSRLEAKLNKSDSVHYFCDSKADWSDLWINVKQLLPYMIDCLIDNMRLEFDPTTNLTRNPAGVDIRVKNGSQVASVEYLNNLQISGFAYFAPIIEQLTNGGLGYERELNIRAAPYDFRKAPNELGDYFELLKDSSEQLTKENGGRPITYICHSMGCNNMLYFLHRQSVEWKSKHVMRLISVAAPWAGSVSAMRAAAVGDDLVFSGIPLVRSNVDDLSENIPKLEQPPSDKQQLLQSNDLAIEDETKTDGLTAKSPPQQGVYTADDFRKFFDDINHPDGYRMWLNTKDLLGSLEAPGVEVWCLVGGGKRTLARIEYVGDFPTSASQELYDDGDGTVTTQSADFCKRWSSQQKQPVYYKQFESDHLAILKDANVLRYIEGILKSDHAISS